MSPTVRNILAVIVGGVIGGFVNMGILQVGMQMIPLPAGADASTMENLSHSIHLYEPKHFITPFLAHALGTLAGAIIAVKIAASHHSIVAMVVGGLFFAGGLTMALVVPSPAWFIALDLVVAYFPMAWLAMKIAGPGDGDTESADVRG